MAPRDQARTAAACRMEKSGKQTQRHEGHRIHGRHRQARHNQSDEQHQDIPLNSVMISVSFFVAVFGHKRGSLIAKKQSLLCAFFVVRNLKMKSIFSGGAQGGRCFVVRSKPQTTWIARRSRRAPQDVVSFWKSLSQSLGQTWDRVHEHIRSAATPCQTASFRMRDSGGKPGATTASWPGLMEHCVCNQDARFRRAGCGIFFGIDDDRNCSFTLFGREQTNNRAELLAVITAMQVHDGNLEIRSDSEYVVRIATSRARGETQKGNVDNADLWEEF